MTALDYDRLRSRVMVNEGTGPRQGTRFFPYTDPAQKLTIGYGRNLSDDGISALEASLLLDHDLDDAIQAVSSQFAWFDGLSGVRQQVIAEMSFNLGLAGLSEFSRMLAAMKSGDYRLAASEMLRSQWAIEVGSRARRLAAMLETGTDASL